MGDTFEIFEYQGVNGCILGYGIMQADDKRPLLLPNNDWILFKNKQSAETVCNLLNTKIL